MFPSLFVVRFPRFAVRDAGSGRGWKTLGRVGNGSLAGIVVVGWLAAGIALAGEAEQGGRSVGGPFLVGWQRSMQSFMAPAPARARPPNPVNGSPVVGSQAEVLNGDGRAAPPLICPPPEARGGKIFPVTGRRGGVVFGRPNPCAAPASADETTPARAGRGRGFRGRRSDRATCPARRGRILASLPAAPRTRGRTPTRASRGWRFSGRPAAAPRPCRIRSTPRLPIARPARCDTRPTGSPSAAAPTLSRPPRNRPPKLRAGWPAGGGSSALPLALPKGVGSTGCRRPRGPQSGRRFRRGR